MAEVGTKVFVSEGQPMMSRFRTFASGIMVMFRRGDSIGRRGRSVRGVVTVLLLAPVGVVVAATAAGAPTMVDIGNGQQQLNGTYLNAQKIADNLVFTSVNVQGGSNITIVDPIDLSTSLSGTPHFNLSLVTPTCNINNSVNMAAVGNLFLTCNIVNLNAPITSDGAPIDPSRVVSTATQVNVLSNAASIQQAVDLTSHTAPSTVNISPGQYSENVDIGHVTTGQSLTLSGNDGTAAAGADPTAPTISGTQAGGNVITDTVNNVTIDGLHLDGQVNGGSSTSSVDGVYANAVSGLTVSHNTIDSFTGPGIETPSSTSVSLNANAIIPVQITSANATTFTTGASGTFTVKTTGSPAALSESGALPPGVTFTDNGDGTAALAGTPSAGSADSYPIAITASNGGVSADATQNFTLTVDAAPAITSEAATTFATGSLGSFTVTTSGNPTPSLAESTGGGQSGLPGWASFSDNGDGTATISGTPPSGSGGTSTFTIAAHNGVSTDATQPFSLTVHQPPAFTSAMSVSFTVGQPGSFTPTATGNPTPTISETGPLPTGVTFSAGVLSGTPAATGTFPITLTASNGVGPSVNQSFTLMVMGFNITTSSLPSAAPGVAYGPVNLQEAGAGTSVSPYVTTFKWKKITLPKGLKLSSTGVLSGTPSAKLVAGPSSVTVQVTETVTTLNGKKKVKTKTTVQATIPLTIT